MFRRSFVCGLLALPLAAEDIWSLARERRQDHVFSTLFEAETVTKMLASDADIDRAMDWCRKSAVTRVFIESFRNGHQVARPILEHAKERFLAAGFAVSSGVTTLGLGRRSTGWKLITCFTDPKSQERLKEVLEYTASLFDEIMIDDFLFTDCTCGECDRARRARSVTIGGLTTTAAGDTWEDYRRELMVRLSRENMLAAAKKVNPRAQIIVKYPQWYDKFQENGYDVAQQTTDFDKIWVGTESRDHTLRKAGGQFAGVVQYEGYFNMRWLDGIGGPKTGGGWYDPYDTSESTYIEQARQTVLAGARESMLFCYGALVSGAGAKDMEALRPHLPALLDVSREVRRRSIIGVAAYKPINSHAEDESYVFDFVGMTGLPLAPCHEFPTAAPAAFFSIHALKDSNFVAELGRFIAAAKPVLLTDGLARRLEGRIKLDATNVQILGVNGKPAGLLELTQTQLDRIRNPLLRPLKTSFQAPNQVSLYLFGDGSYVLENFNDQPVNAVLNGRSIPVPARDWILHWS
jgi:hypothetical protein